MILSALISFLGGATARAFIGFIIKWLEQKQTHAQEMERMRFEAEIDQARHERSVALVKQQADLKLGEIKVIGEQTIGLADAQAFVEAMKTANQPTGVRWIDGWNGCVRPATATIAIALWGLKIVKAGLVLTAWDESLVGSVLGYYFADRQLGKRR